MGNKGFGSLLFSALQMITRRDLRFVLEYSDKPLKEALRDKPPGWQSARARKLYLKHHQKIPIKIGKLLQESSFMSIKGLKDQEEKSIYHFL